ncbi:NlpC/P60 family protein [Streptomyces sp. NPDC006879]|uniref:C40 family peptidase n=1 Tax=Streptomyces sp. NPDC006879 TaxID=3364767 RepID=UPI0036809207
MASHRRSVPSGPDRSTRVTVLSAAAVATAAAAISAGPALAEPTTPEGGARARVDRLFTEAERATEAYNEAGERAKELRGQMGSLQDAVARTQQDVNTMRGVLGGYAGAQYRSGGIDPGLALMLSEHPDDYLDKASALGRLTARQAGRLGELRRAQRQLGQQRQEALGKLAELDRLRADVARHKRAVTAKLALARKLLNEMPVADRAAFERASRSGGRDQASAELIAGAGGASSARAAAAVNAVRGALGKPYVWGATGPSGFDCSGLMVWSYRQAGISLPRTSQAQRFAGRRIPLSEARPGDLVTYRSDASHVGMYVGNGQVIHAPYPGAPVRYDPVGMMPVATVTRV